MEQAAQGGFVLRSRRDDDLVALGVGPECLALIGGGNGHRIETAASVATWLSQSAELYGLFAPFAVLLHHQMHGVRSKDGTHIFRARAVSGMSLARHLTAAMVASESERQERDRTAVMQAKRSKQSAPSPLPSAQLQAPPQHALYVGAFIASMIEGADLSDTVAALYGLFCRVAAAEPAEGRHLPKVMRDIVAGVERDSNPERSGSDTIAEDKR